MEGHESLGKLGVGAQELARSDYVKEGGARRRASSRKALCGHALG